MLIANILVFREIQLYFYDKVRPQEVHFHINFCRLMPHSLEQEATSGT